jgi:thiamine pyrophosphate-dependent acetolactate synthase large subunit-like protein
LNPNLGDLHAAWPITQPDAFYTMASGGLGWGAPASVGIALAERDSGRNRLVVMVIGDGSFQYSVQSIWTAAQLRLPVLFVVLRNGEYAILKAFAEVEDSPGVPRARHSRHRHRLSRPRIRLPRRTGRDRRGAAVGSRRRGRAATHLPC